MCLNSQSLSAPLEQPPVVVGYVSLRFRLQLVRPPPIHPLHNWVRVLTATVTKKCKSSGISTLSTHTLEGGGECMLTPAESELQDKYARCGRNCGEDSHHARQPPLTPHLHLIYTSLPKQLGG
jgi:hypothetical protein